MIKASHPLMGAAAMLDATHLFESKLGFSVLPKHTTMDKEGVRFESPTLPL